MILYCIEHQGFTLDMLQYHLVKHSGEDAILLIDTTQAFRTQSLDFSKVFKKTIRYNPSSFRLENNPINLKNEILKYYYNFFNENEIDLSSINLIYSFADVHNSFGIFLYLIGKPYIVMSTDHYYLACKDRYDHARGWYSEELVTLQRDSGALCGEGHEVITELDFDFNHAYKLLTPQQTDLILGVFGINSESFIGDFQILALNSLGFVKTSGVTTTSAIGLMYQTLADYYLSPYKRTIIKPHPTEFEYILPFFPSSFVDTRPYNLEIIKLFNSSSITVCTIFSSVQSKLSGFCDVYVAGIPFMSLYTSIDVIDVISKLSLYLNKIRINIQCKDKSETLTKSFIDGLNNIEGVIFEKDTNNCISFEFDDTQKQYSVIICENRNKCTNFKKIKLLLKKKTFFRDNSACLESKLIDVYVDSQDIYNQIIKFQYVKHLKYLGITCYTETDNDLFPSLTSSHDDSFKSWLAGIAKNDTEYVRLIWNKLKISDNLDFCESISEDLPPKLMSSLGRDYRYGKNVTPCYPLAIFWMKKAIVKGDIEVSNDLFDLLWAIGTPEALSDAVSFGLPLAEAGVLEMQSWISRAYRYGKGVSKDLNKAAEWMRKVAHNNISWAKIELFDILWEINTIESSREMIDVITEEVESKNGLALERMGRMYFYGRGVSKDLVKAAEMMRSARDKGVRWANWELFGILWQIGTPESMSEAITFGLPLAENGVPEMQGWIARCYRDGKGVQKDLQKAIYWMQKAADSNLWWAKKELTELSDQMKT